LHACVEAVAGQGQVVSAVVVPRQRHHHQRVAALHITPMLLSRASPRRRHGRQVYESLCMYMYLDEAVVEDEQLPRGYFSYQIKYLFLFSIPLEIIDIEI
jgi:hypothetical protein